jgi:hypothetical protein
MASQIDGIEETNRKMKAALDRIGGPLTERFVTEMLIAAGARAATYTPVATSALINSQYRKTWQAQQSWIGELGYGADYARYVHEAKGTLMGTNTPRSPARLGNVWGPNGQPKFLEKGVEEMIKDDLAGIIRRSFK